MQIFPLLTKNRGKFQKEIAYFKYTLQPQVFIIKKIKPTFHWQLLRSLRARQSTKEIWYSCFSIMLFILIILFFYFSYSCCIFYNSSIRLTQTLISSLIWSSSRSQYSTRYSDFYRPHTCRTNIKKFSILFQGPRIWNSLPNDIKNAPSFSIFKRVIKPFLRVRQNAT